MCVYITLIMKNEEAICLGGETPKGFKGWQLVGVEGEKGKETMMPFYFKPNISKRKCT